MRHNKKFFWILALLMVGIWGTIIYRIVDAVAEGDSAESIALDSSTESQSIPEERFSYKDDVRDPFQYRAKPRRSIAVRRDTAARAPWTEPPYKLIGVMQKDRVTTAVLQRVDGFTFFVRKGDTLGGVKILGLDQQFVQYQYHGQRREWKLSQTTQ